MTLCLNIISEGIKELLVPEYIHHVLVLVLGEIVDIHRQVSRVFTSSLSLLIRVICIGALNCA